MRTIFMTAVVSVLMIPTTALAQFPNTPSLRDAVDRVPMTFAAQPSSPAAVRRQQASDNERGWPGRHPVLFGALLGFGIGVGSELAVIPGGSGGEPHSVYLRMFGGVGAGIGSIVGLIASAARR